MPDMQKSAPLIEDVAEGDEQIIVAVGQRRFLFSELSPALVSRIRHLRSNGLLDQSAEGRLLLARIRGSIENEVFIPQRHGGLTIPSSKVRYIAEQIGFLASLPCSVFISLWAMMSVTWLFKWHEFSERFFGSDGSGDYLVAGLIYVISVYVHEMGHATMAFKETGLVGSISLRFSTLLPRISVDVSSLHLATPQRRSWVALAGPFAQASFAGCCLIIPHATLQMGGYLALFAALFSLVPTPGSDGFWALNDSLENKIINTYRNKVFREKIKYPFTLILISINVFILYATLEMLDYLFISNK